MEGNSGVDEVRSFARTSVAATDTENAMGTVVEVNEHGLVLDVRARAFLPAAWLDIRPLYGLDEFLGQELECRVVGLLPQSDQLVVSRREILEEERDQAAAEVVAELRVGDVCPARVSKVTELGAFVELSQVTVPGVEFFTHIPDLLWGTARRPSDVVALGDPAQAKVLEVDSARRHILFTLA